MPYGDSTNQVLAQDQSQSKLNVVMQSDIQITSEDEQDDIIESSLQYLKARKGKVPADTLEMDDEDLTLTDQVKETQDN